MLQAILGIMKVLLGVAALFFLATLALEAISELRSPHPDFPGLIYVLAFFAAPAVVVAVRVIDRQRHKTFMERKRLGLCAHCGYDISGNAGKCPECGKWTVRERV